jgi:EmrB/QacA subfamily drug resistance transporter
MNASAGSIAQEKTSDSNKWNVLIIVMVGTFMSVLDSSIVNVSIPAIMADFGVGVDDIEWTMTGYMLAFATLMPLTAWLRDRIGYKAIFVWAMVIFTIGSLLCGLAWNLPSLMVARILQALGGGAISPTGMAMITEAFPKSERGKALGIWGMGIMVGPALGPTLGGYLTHTFGWRSIFLVNIPIGIIGVIAAIEMLVKDTPVNVSKKAFDFWGFAFLTVFLVSFLLGMSKGESEGWTSAYIITCGVLSFLGLVGFLLVELHVQDKIMDIELFKIPAFSITAMISVVRSIGLFGGTFLIPLFVQQQMGFNELQSGLMLLPSSLLLMLTIPIVSRMADKAPVRPMAIIGLILLAYFMLVYSHIDVNTSMWDMIWPTLVRSVAMAMLMAPIMTLTMNCVPQNKIGMASSMSNVIQQVGGSVGIAFFTSALTNRAHYHMSVVAQGMHSGTAEFSESIKNVAYHAHGLGFTHAQSAMIGQSFVMQQVSQSAMVMSFQDTFLIGMILMVVAIPLAMLLPNKMEHHVNNAKVDKEVMLEVLE